MTTHQSNTRGGTSEQPAKPGNQSHKHPGNSQGASRRGGTSQQNAKAGSKHHQHD